MRSGNLETLKLKILGIRLGLLKASGSYALSIPTSCLIEVLRFSEDDYLWCATSDLSAAEITKTHNAKVKLKFVQRENGLFIKLAGRAEVIGTPAAAEDLNSNNSAGHHHKPVTLKIKIEYADCFKKRSTSRYTSFLQSISHFATSRAFANRGA